MKKLKEEEVKKILSKYHFLNYNGPAGPQEHFQDQNTLAFGNMLRESEFFDFHWDCYSQLYEEGETSLMIVFKDNIELGYDRWGFIASPNTEIEGTELEDIDQADAYSTYLAIYNRYGKEKK